jgi:hypothetical protein
MWIAAQVGEWEAGESDEEKITNKFHNRTTAKSGGGPITSGLPGLSAGGAVHEAGSLRANTFKLKTDRIGFWFWTAGALRMSWKSPGIHRN